MPEPFDLERFIDQMELLQSSKPLAWSFRLRLLDMHLSNLKSPDPKGVNELRHTIIRWHEEHDKEMADMQAALDHVIRYNQELNQALARDNMPPDESVLDGYGEQR